MNEAVVPKGVVSDGDGSGVANGKSLLEEPAPDPEARPAVREIRKIIKLMLYH